MMPPGFARRRRRRAPAAAPVAFDFSSVANLAFQYDARRTVGADGSAVSSMANYQGSALLDLSAASGEEFLVAVGGLNGNRVLRGRNAAANGGPSSLVRASTLGSSFTGARAFTGWAVASFRSVTDQTFLMRWVDGSGGTFSLSFDGSGTLSWKHGDVAGKVELAYAPGTDPHVFEVYRSVDDYDLRIDGVSHTATILNAAAMDVTGSATLGIGARAAGVFGVIGDLALVLGYKAALSGSDRAAIRTAITSITGLAC